MLRPLRSASGLCLLLALSPPALLAQVSILPPNGIIAGTTYAVSRTTVNVSGQSFTQAARLQTATQPAHTYDAGITLGITAPVAKDDVLAGEVWMRRVTPANRVVYTTFNFEKAGPNYDKSHAVTLISDSASWTRFRFAFKSIAAYSAGGAQVAFHLGFPPQTIELGGLRLTNYAKTQPLSAFTNDLSYGGHEPDAAWRAPAQARIAQVRQADLSVAVRDTAGSPVPGANVSVLMKRHAFGFGSAVDGGRLLGNYGSSFDRQKYQGLITNWFNRVVLENDLKWQNWEANPNTAKSAVSWLTDHGVAVRGHNLIWPSAKFMPADVPSLYDEPSALRERINQHFTDVLSQVTGRCFEWDVINEPYDNHEVMDVLGANEKVEWFRLARRLDPTAVLYLNEYGNLEAAGLKAPQTDDFFKQLKFLRDAGAPLGGIGMQGHFGGFLSAPEEMLAMLDRFSTFGLPIQVTEFDADVPDETIQADYLRDFMTTLFSHPSVSGILSWGFWEGQHWKPNAAMVRNNWQLKPNGVMWSNLVFGEWWTTTNAVTDAAGNATVRGFKGEYEVKVTAQDQVWDSPVSLTENRSLTAVVNVALPPTLSAVVQGGKIHLAWPGNATGYHVEETTALVPTAWLPVGPEPALSDGAWHVAIDLTAGPRFYRLER